MPVLRAPAVRRHQNRRAARGAPRAHHDAADPLGHRLRSQRSGRGARPTSAFTGGGNGTHQVYISGLTDHRLKDADIVDHLVELVEKKAAEIETEKQQEQETALEAAQ
jgi:hypothetical protein